MYVTLSSIWCTYFKLHALFRDTANKILVAYGYARFLFID